MITKNEKGKIEVEFYDSITFEDGKVICHMKNIDIILSSTRGLPVLSGDDLWGFKEDDTCLEVTAVIKKKDFKYAVNCINSHSLELGMVANDVINYRSKYPDTYAIAFFDSMVECFADCTNSKVACYHSVNLVFVCGKHRINIKVLPDQVVMVDNLNLYDSIEGFVYEQQHFNDYDNSYFVEITNSESGC